MDAPLYNETKTIIFKRLKGNFHYQKDIPKLRQIASEFTRLGMEYE